MPINQPSFPTSIQVVLGSMWTGYSTLSEDDVMVLTRAYIDADTVMYTEDGTNTANLTTNRVKLSMNVLFGTYKGNATPNVAVYGPTFANLYATFANPTDFLYAFIQKDTLGTGYYYTFKEVFANNNQYLGGSTITTSNSGYPLVFKSMVGITSDFPYTATGGLLIGGESLESVDYAFVATGGATIGGQSLEATDYIDVAIGGLVIGGLALDSIYYNHTSSGGFILDGQAISEIVGLNHIASGGLILSGQATYSINAFEHISDGGLIFAGNTEVASSSHSFAASGGLAVSGQVDASNVGYIRLGGEATANVAFSFIGQGSLVLAGNSIAAISDFQYTTFGGLNLSDTFLIYVDYIYQTPSSGILISGESFNIFNLTTTSSGGVVVSGSADCTVMLPSIGQGGVVLSGEATSQIMAFGYIAFGGLNLSDTFLIYVDYIYQTPSSGILISGESTIDLEFIGATSGGVVVGGSADMVPIYDYYYTSIAGLIIAGEAFALPGVVGLGGVVVGGNVIATVAFSHMSTGGLNLGGTIGIPVFGIPFTATGGLTVADTAGFVVDYFYEVTGALILSGEVAVQVDYIYEVVEIPFTFSGESTPVVEYVYDVVVTPWVLGGDADVDFRLFYTWTGGTQFAGAADSALRDLRYIARAGIVLFAITKVVVTVSDYFFEASQNSQDLRFRGNARVSSCGLNASPGIRCLADCNAEVPMLLIESEPLKVIRGKESSSRRAAYVPAITVCNQNLWVPCPQQGGPVVRHRTELEKRKCSKKRFNTKR